MCGWASPTGPSPPSRRRVPPASDDPTNPVRHRSCPGRLAPLSRPAADRHPGRFPAGHPAAPARRAHPRRVRRAARRRRAPAVRRAGRRGPRAGEPGSTADSVVAADPAETASTRVIEFEPALDRVDQVTFAIRAAADGFIDALTEAAAGLHGGRRSRCTPSRARVSQRSWLHPRWFTAADVVDRVRWQLQGGGSHRYRAALRHRAGADHARNGSIRPATTSRGCGVGARRTHPPRTHPGAEHARPRRRAHRGASAAGGCSPTGRSWCPGAMRRPGPAPCCAVRRRSRGRAACPGWRPATVFTSDGPLPCVAAGGEPSTSTSGACSPGRPAGSPPPANGRRPRPIDAWAGPWPVIERWWDAERGRGLHRFQVVDADGNAWLLALRGSTTPRSTAARTPLWLGGSEVRLIAGRMRR